MLLLISVAALSFFQVVAALAPLEPPQGQVLLGAWYDRNNSDTPAAVNARIGYRPLAFFQTDIDFSGTVKPWTAPSITDQFLQQLKDSKTNAYAMLTLYPFMGYSAITDAQLADMAERINAIVNAGHPVFVRFAPEMNGSWFIYGQDPAGFIAAWRRCITYWRQALGTNSNQVAFIWSPNSGNGYPYFKQEFSIDPNATDASTLSKIKLLDTNLDGVLDKRDDPYTPYYPGDAYVDWVGMSIYHYGIKYPWVDNAIPESDKFEKYLNGHPSDGDNYGYYPFYTNFATGAGCVNNITKTVASTGNKPLIISETAATFHFDWVNPMDQFPPNQNTPAPGYGQSATRLQIKQAWWRSFLNNAFLSKYPQMKAVSTFEFIKSEEMTWRDFTTFGAAPNPHGNSNFDTDNNLVANWFAADASANMPFLVFAQAMEAGGKSETRLWFGWPIWAWACIAVGAFLVLSTIVLVTWCCCCRKRGIQQKRTKKHASVDVVYSSAAQEQENGTDVFIMANHHGLQPRDRGIELQGLGGTKAKPTDTASPPTARSGYSGLVNDDRDYYSPQAAAARMLQEEELLRNRPDNQRQLNQSDVQRNGRFQQDQPKQFKDARLNAHVSDQNGVQANPQQHVAKSNEGDTKSGLQQPQASRPVIYSEYYTLEKQQPNQHAAIESLLNAEPNKGRLFSWASQTPNESNLYMNHSYNNNHTTLSKSVAMTWKKRSMLFGGGGDELGPDQERLSRIGGGINLLEYPEVLIPNTGNMRSNGGTEDMLNEKDGLRTAESQSDMSLDISFSGAETPEQRIAKKKSYMHKLSVYSVLSKTDSGTSSFESSERKFNSTEGPLKRWNS